ncbi:hypothetical protein ACV22Y_05415 [Burkholderia sp. AW50-3]
MLSDGDSVVPTKALRVKGSAITKAIASSAAAPWQSTVIGICPA